MEIVNDYFEAHAGEIAFEDKIVDTLTNVNPVMVELNELGKIIFNQNATVSISSRKSENTK